MIDIDPDEFEKRRRGPSSTPAEEMPQCPECASVTVHRKVGGTQRGEHRKLDGDYFCTQCGAHFDIPDNTPEAEM